MERNQLVAGLRRYAFTEPALIRGQYLAQFLAQYFEGMELPEEELGSDIPQHLVGALEEFRTSEGSLVAALRRQHEQDTRTRYPNLAAPRGEILLIDQAISDLVGIFTEATGTDWVGREIKEVFRSPLNAIELEFRRFIGVVYSRGLESIIRSQRTHLRTAHFGETALRCHKDRYLNFIGLVFVRQGEDMEQTVFFALPFDKEDGPRWTLAELWSTVPAALSMIADVTKHWPTDPAEKRKAFKLQQQTGLF